MKKSVIGTLLLLSLVVASDARSSWVDSMERLESTSEIRKSYMKGLLLDQTYGMYRVEGLLSEDLVQHFYDSRDYRTFWFNGFGEADLSIVDMISAIKRASNEGLDPEDYHLAEIDALFDEIEEGNFYSKRDATLATIALDILLTDAFVTLAHDLHEGLIDYDAFQAKLKKMREATEINYVWDMPLKHIDPIALLKRVKRDGEIEEALYSLVTQNHIYIDLVDAYERYKMIVSDGGFVQVPNVTLKLGSRGKAVKLLAQRLHQSDDLDFYDEGYVKFDKSLQRALKRFQRRMGLWPSGVLNRSTRRALNVPAHTRLKQIKLNLERARWERDPMDCSYLFVNIPAFMVYFMEDDKIRLKMRVVVGRKKNPTPIFKSYMSYIVLNPTWSVPQSIVKKEMLKRLQEDPDYLAARNFKAYNGWSKNRKEIDPFDIDWYQYDENSDLPFSFVKQPGAGNPLGRVKFMFPNRYAVYMHDTNEKKLFKRAIRAYSHGCIRLHQPQKMLEFVADNYMDKSYDELKGLLKKTENSSFQLQKRIPVYIRYYTSWVNEDGVNFRNDIYGYDKIQFKLMRKI
jgi:murein L,D-transpeptidase YcbB/YkuD